MKFSRYPVTELGSRRLYFVMFFHLSLLAIAFSFFMPRWSAPAGLPIALPRSLTSEPVSGGGVVVSIAETGDLFVEGRLMSRASFRELLAQRVPGGDTSVLVKIDRKARVGVLAEIWDLCRAAGVARVSIVTNA